MRNADRQSKIEQNEMSALPPGYLLGSKEIVFIVLNVPKSPLIPWNDRESPPKSAQTSRKAKRRTRKNQCEGRRTRTPRIVSPRKVSPKIVVLQRETNRYNVDPVKLCKHTWAAWRLASSRWPWEAIGIGETERERGAPTRVRAVGGCPIPGGHRNPLVSFTICDLEQACRTRVAFCRSSKKKKKKLISKPSPEGEEDDHYCLRVAASLV